MNAFENPLKVHVEKAVRPVRASRQRKLMMREELLAHLEGIYDEELQRLERSSADVDSAKAVEAALQRFGSADEICRRLQASVPWRSFGVWCFFRGIGDGSLAAAQRWAMRWVAWLMLLGVLPWLAAGVVVQKWQLREASALWAAFGAYGVVTTWAWLRYAALAAGILGEGNADARAHKLLSRAAVCWTTIMTLPGWFWSGYGWGPHIRSVWAGNDEKLGIVAVVAAIVVAMMGVALRSKEMAEHLRVERQNDVREADWLRMEIDN